MINFIVAIAVALGAFGGFYLITGSLGTAAIAGLIGGIIAAIAVGFYTGQRSQEIKKNNEAPLHTDRTPERENNQGYKPDSENERKIKDPTD
ncbi:hypothetical protein KP77_30190 [Jeotgalibacillus alimentarius]|uniref:Uncharacterized protein n=1 Tax=Jeotgalibacillus alimentarius TaxID=135826 RepID=A0A0C2R199_9BACL|nr:hypothetical protein [Jeotgalibacillus alimentarius]KIL44070.1 hypothetical protein KP77_30190 [Jeotgalibacillus alimentarius]